MVIYCVDDEKAQKPFVQKREPSELVQRSTQGLCEHKRVWALSMSYTRVRILALLSTSRVVVAAGVFTPHVYPGKLSVRRVWEKRNKYARGGKFSHSPFNVSPRFIVATFHYWEDVSECVLKST